MFEGIPLFEHLTSTQMEKLSLFCQERLLKGGEVLFAEGDEASALYILKSGLLKVYRSVMTGEEETIVTISHAGDLIGEMALFGDDTPRRRSASIKAIEMSRVIVIMDYAIRSLSREEPAIIDSIRRVITERRTSS